LGGFRFAGLSPVDLLGGWIPPALGERHHGRPAFRRDLA